MRNYIFSILILLFLAFLASCLSAESTDSQDDNKTVYSQIKLDTKKSDSIQHILTKIVNDGKAPGMIAAISSGEGVIALASAGVRKAGSDISFTTDDYVHLGSCTKAMTSTMIATLVAEGKLSWDMKLIEALPELKNRIHTDYYDITLWQLLTHRAGLPANAMDWDIYKHKEIKARRLAILEDNLQGSASFKNGNHHYSNFGYMIAACMAEKITGNSWEYLIQKRLFDPLDMSSAGFGTPNTHNKIDQPWGHSRGRSSSVNTWKTHQYDNPKALGPAGRVHISLEDWAKFIAIFLNKENPVLESNYLNKLIEPAGDYAGGWFVIEQPWVEGEVLIHGGTNGIWYALVVLAPTLNRAFIVATNSCDLDVTPELCNEMIKKMIKIELHDNKDSVQGELAN